MPTPRSRLAAASVGGMVYAVGGLVGGDKGGCEDSGAVEVFDPERGTWIKGPPLNIGRHAHAAVAWRGHVWVLGGYATEQGSEPLATVESMDPRWRTWRPEPPMVHGRAWFVATADQATGAVVALGNGTGGSPGPERLSGGSRWTVDAATDLTGRRAAGTSVEGVVWIIGGEDAGGATARRYDARAGRWVEEARR
jgi:hypothetical protein